MLSLPRADQRTTAGSLRGHHTAAKWKPGCCGQPCGRPSKPTIPSGTRPRSRHDVEPPGQVPVLDPRIHRSPASPSSITHDTTPHSNDPLAQDTKHQIMIQASQTNHTSPLQKPPTTHDTRHRMKHPDPTITDPTTIEPRYLLRSNSIPTTQQVSHICDVPASPKRHSFSQVRAFSLVGRGALFARISRDLYALSMLVMSSRGVYSRRFAVSVLRRADLLL